MTTNNLYVKDGSRGPARGGHKAFRKKDQNNRKDVKRSQNIYSGTRIIFRLYPIQIVRDTSRNHRSGGRPNIYYCGRLGAHMVPHGYSRSFLAARKSKDVVQQAPQAFAG